MKNYYILLITLLISFTINAQIVDIPDPVFKDRLVNGYCVDSDGNGSADTNADTNNDGEIQVTEALAVTNLYLYCFNSSCQFSSVEGLEAFTNLEYLELSNHNITSLNVTTLTNLNTFICRSNNSLTTIELGSLPNLSSLECGGSQLTSLDVSLLTNLTSLKCTGTQLSTLDVSGLSNLSTLECRYNQINTLTLGTLSNLNYLDCSDNLLSTIDLSGLTITTTLNCVNNQLNSLNISGLTILERLYCNNNQITNLDASNLLNLDVLACNDNELTNLKISGLTSLTSLSCNNNQLSTLELSSLVNLEGLACSNNQLTSLNLDSAPYLVSLNCGFNQIATLDLSLQTNLNSLSCGSNQLTELDISPLVNLNTLDCSSNQISELDFTNVSLSNLYCQNNLLTSIDASNMTAQFLNCANNQLITLNIKNGYINKNGEILSPYDLRLLDFSNNPDLINVCADDEPIYAGNWPYYELNIVQNLINQYGYTTCAVNGYCSFTPGGEFYTIEGTVILDSDDNGCDNNDSGFPNLNFGITDGTETGNFIANSSGAYMIPVQEGSHTITPTFETTSYFTISPSNVSISFPTDASPYMQDFCITPNGEFNDLEITIIPLGVARPGFDANYKVIYKNKGTTSLTGDIDFDFADNLMDFVSASPTEDTQSLNLLTWNFNDLEPFESREILLTMNINSPMETPPVNGDDVLVFDASVNSSETDETPDDNTFELQQTVVNSYDPNDKTCLEGAFITPEMVGDYVHYMIRFENTGSANAINIVVKDDIDRLTYDLSSLIPLHASHDYVARIKDNASDHYVEFIFENINLPFDDANNDGYIVFKIRTLNTLELNDTFENDAEIYFDFNFPIITNNEQTTIATLSTEDFELANNSISLYPNPATNHLTLESKQAIKHISIYDISGRLINEVAFIGTKTELTISTEALSAGTYFLKIKTETGDIVKQLIKD
ncbi:T9SS type A sorting domain-containing protein [Psychroserpens ponticola]|uniref:T9SS type A sorting domain-containing protein n=1 Tax=Psychroserpens ponticola TaxID=2932268 RepID=A0ABY7RW80_9FLAO|nr:T9SS type A sorting domain-containing protein [Psychroserpens ponticola]WCO01375.1 T9SS type A sorting domain-containing protein [Psychroserpens ponticola]